MSEEQPDERELLKVLTDRVRLFEGLEPHEVIWVLKHARKRALSEGMTVVSPDLPAGRMFIILAGEVSIQMNRNGTLEEVARLGAGATVGEMSIIDSAPRSATVVATAYSTLLEFDRHWLDGAPPGLGMRIFRNLASILAERLRISNTADHAGAGWPVTREALGSRLVETGLVDICLVGVKATRIEFRGADLRNALFQKADLRGANFSGADLRGAFFDPTPETATPAELPSPPDDDDAKDAKKLTERENEAKTDQVTDDGKRDQAYWERLRKSVREKAMVEVTEKARLRQTLSD